MQNIKFTLILSITVLFTGCRLLIGGIESPQFTSEMAVKEALIESKKNVPQFLLWDGGIMEASWLPGLKEKEIETLKELGKCEYRQFHYYHLDFHKEDSKRGRKISAMFSYAEVFNKALVEILLEGAQPVEGGNSE